MHTLTVALLAARAAHSLRLDEGVTPLVPKMLRAAALDKARRPVV